MYIYICIYVYIHTYLHICISRCMDLYVQLVNKGTLKCKGPQYPIREDPARQPSAPARL